MQHCGNGFFQWCIDGDVWMRFQLRPEALNKSSDSTDCIASRLRSRGLQLCCNSKAYRPKDILAPCTETTFLSSADVDWLNRHTGIQSADASWSIDFMAGQGDEISPEIFQRKWNSDWSLDSIAVKPCTTGMCNGRNIENRLHTPNFVVCMLNRDDRRFAIHK